MAAPTENDLRWRAYRLARERGYADAPTYDYYLHPRTRVDLRKVLEDLGPRAPYALLVEYGLAPVSAA